MKYFNLTNASGTKETGQQYPQVQDMGGSYRFDTPNAISKVPHTKFPDFTPNLDCFVLHRKAKLTDFISATTLNRGFLVSEKVKNILSNFNLVPHRFYPATVAGNENMHEDYYWFFYISDQTEFIDYSQTKFYLTNLSGREKIKDLEINSKNDLLNVKKEISLGSDIKTDTIYFNSSFDKNLDLFKIAQFNFNTYISGRLAEDLEKHNVTGMRLNEVDIFKFS